MLLQSIQVKNNQIITCTAISETNRFADVKGQIHKSKYRLDIVVLEVVHFDIKGR